MIQDVELELYARLRGQLAAEDLTTEVGPRSRALPSVWRTSYEAYLWFCDHELLTAEELQDCREAFEEGYNEAVLQMRARIVEEFRLSSVIARTCNTSEAGTVKQNVAVP